MPANRSGASSLSGVEAGGRATDEENVDELTQAEVVCAPSLFSESFGIVLVEVTATGVAVGASDCPAIGPFFRTAPRVALCARTIR